MVNIIQHGVDGFGHQLHGLFSCLILHNVKKFYFDGYSFLKKDFRFQHIHNEEVNNVTKYLREIVILFIKKYNIQEVKINKHIHSHEVYKIPNNYEINTLYSLDNAYIFEKLNLTDKESNIHKQNIENISNLFVNRYLPENKLDNNNIVFHFRLGDAMTTGRCNSINSYNSLLIKLIDIFIHIYPNYKYYLHTDGDISFFENKLKEHNINYIINNKKTPLLNVLSDFIYSKIFICGNSSLSKVCSFLGNKELTIICDDNYHSMPDNVYKISNYINNNSKLIR